MSRTILEASRSTDGPDESGPGNVGVPSPTRRACDAEQHSLPRVKVKWMKRNRRLEVCGPLLVMSLVGCGGGITSTATPDAGSDGASSGGSGAASSGGASASVSGSSGSMSGSSGASGSGGSGSSSGGSSGGPASGSSSGGSSSGGCGVSGKPCCGTDCNAGNICIAVGSVSTCSACGGPGQPSCGTMPACADEPDFPTLLGSLEYCVNNEAGTTGQPGEKCTTTCVDATDACYGPPGNGSNSFCVVCGGLDGPCCGATCETGLRCMSGTCQ